MQSKDLPTFVRYKIRMDADSIDSTMYLEDRINRPGPRARRGIDLKYIYYGFAFLQVNKEDFLVLMLALPSGAENFYDFQSQ